MKRLIEALQVVEDLRVGRKEAIALFTIADMKGKAQARDVGKAVGDSHRTFIFALRQKGLVRTIPNETGHSFYDLTPYAKSALKAATEGMDWLQPSQGGG